MGWWRILMRWVPKLRNKAIGVEITERQERNFTVQGSHASPVPTF